MDTSAPAYNALMKETLQALNDVIQKNEILQNKEHKNLKLMGNLLAEAQEMANRIGEVKPITDREKLVYMLGKVHGCLYVINLLLPTPNTIN